MRRACFLLLSSCAVACAGAQTGATAFEPSYFTSEEMGTSRTVPSCAAPLSVVVIDGRQEQGNVGVRFTEDEPNVQYPIRMEGDVASYVQSALERALERAGQSLGTKTPGAMHVRVTQLRLEEKVFRNSEFDGKVGLEVTLAFAGSELPCWKGELTGVGENYGRAGSEVNYQETVNRALDNAADQLLSAPGFADALCGKCSE
ncbi:MAG: YajG family lipoprotein [Myxococcaceae bacterium]|nr:YajG family lipoprotein [Myxococcaceae bacterium]MCI0672639.1 YajG family lipoprotein [Myxococcaceae bacterium]